MTLRKANKSRRIGKTPVEWEAEVATLNHELNHQKEEVRTNKEKFMRARALASTYQRKNQRLEAQVRDARATRVENEALIHRIQELEQSLQDHQSHTNELTKAYEQRELDWQATIEQARLNYQEQHQHLTQQVQMAQQEADDMIEVARSIRRDIAPVGDREQRLLGFLDCVITQCNHVRYFQM